MVRSSLLRVALGRPRPVRQTLGCPVPSARGISVPPCPLRLRTNRREAPMEAELRSGSQRADADAVVERLPRSSLLSTLCASVL